MTLYRPPIVAVVYWSTGGLLVLTFPVVELHTPTSPSCISTSHTPTCNSLLVFLHIAHISWTIEALDVMVFTLRGKKERKLFGGHDLQSASASQHEQQPTSTAVNRCTSAALQAYRAKQQQLEVAPAIEIRTNAGPSMLPATGVPVNGGGFAPESSVDQIVATTSSPPRPSFTSTTNHQASSSGALQSSFPVVQQPNPTPPPKPSDNGQFINQPDGLLPDAPLATTASNDAGESLQSALPTGGLTTPWSEITPRSSASSPPPREASRSPSTNSEYFDAG
ncbi:hypothetical protein EJ08DRAFT_657436 [Tothia fuscella]|uniref:Uncharacterized protein n=1 Tax=Tothia fuscella TaxID=1048955 RepID=A0A9P4NXG5_9PEZI|nr:hypothetical protein EJ08DRAFT_657436 [Tothia fuscella]